jgi:DNA-binding MarR family transcriptional regulator
MDVNVDDVANSLFVSMGLLRRRLRDAGTAGGLSFPEVAALARLERGGPAAAAELARVEQISAQSMGATIAALEDRGLVARRADPSDGRRILLAATPDGLAELRHRRSERVHQIAEVLSGFTTGELRRIAAAAPLIERLASAL